MTTLTRSAGGSERLLLDGRPLWAGDVIEVCIVGRWQRATVTFDQMLGVYRARVLDLGQEMLLFPSLRARFPQPATQHAAAPGASVLCGPALCSTALCSTNGCTPAG